MSAEHFIIFHLLVVVVVSVTNVVHFILLYFNIIHKFPIMSSLNYNKDLFTWPISA